MPAAGPAGRVEAWLEGRAGGPLVLDGGLGSAREARGARCATALWTAELLRTAAGRALTEAVHLAYLEAGADVVTTSSYQASHPGCQRCGLAPAEADALLLASVSLAEAARAAFLRGRSGEAAEGPGSRPAPLIAGSMGPYGAYLADGSEFDKAYAPEVTRAVLKEFHRPRLRTLAASACDLLAFETVPCAREAEAIVEVLAEEGGAGGKPVWVSFSCKDDATASHGDPFAACMRAVEASDHVQLVGVNCTAPEHVEALLRTAAATTSKRLVAYPNKGEDWDKERRRWVAGSATADEAFAELAVRWRAAGAAVIGGCCRTTEATVAGLKRALDGAGAGGGGGGGGGGAGDPSGA